MTEISEIPIGRTPEDVAVELMIEIAQTETPPNRGSGLYRAYILDLYADCLATVTGKRVPSKPVAALAGRVRVA
jgi:hypothetical protein